MIELDLTKVNDYKTFNIGINKCYVNGVKIKTSQAGNKMLEVSLRNLDDATLIDRLPLTEKAMWRVKQFLKACQLPHHGKVAFEEKDLLSRHLMVECFAEAYKRQDGTDGTAIKVKTYLEDPNVQNLSVSSVAQAEESAVEEEDIPL